MGFPGGSEGKESNRNTGGSGSIPGSERSPGERRSYPLQYSWASLMVQLVKNLPAMQETLGSIPGSGRSLGKGKVYLLQYSGLENSMGPRGRKRSDMTKQLSLSRAINYNTNTPNNCCDQVTNHFIGQSW